jgi:hypothetical protein
MSTIQHPKTGFVQEFYHLQVSFGNTNEDIGLLKSSILAQIYRNHYDVDSSASQVLQIFEPAFTTWIQEKMEIGFGLKLTTDQQKCIVKVIAYDEEPNPLNIQVQIVITLYDGYAFAIPEALRTSLSLMYDAFAELPKVHISCERSYMHGSAKNKANGFLNIPRHVPLLWSASGASISLLQNSYTDQNKYKNLGAAILITGCFATVSMGFALSYVTHAWWAILPIALLWGLAIINIDMLIVNTMQKTTSWSWRAFGGFWSRVLLAVIIAVSISIPLEMTILRDEIRDEIDRHDRITIENEVNKAKAEYADLPQLKERQTLLRAQFIEEMQGKPTASGYRGYGVIAQKIEAELKDLDLQILQLETKRDQALSGTAKELVAQQNANNKYGFLASFRALHRLEFATDDQSVLYISLGIKALLLMLELMPILAKALMPRGVYDSLYEREVKKLM